MLSAPLAPSENVAAPPKAVLSLPTIVPIVSPAATLTLACLATSPFGPLSVKLIVPPAAKPPASPADSPVALIVGTEDWNKLLSPKNCEKPVPARLDGVVASSCTTMPLLPLAATVSAPLPKLALPLEPSAELSAVVKLPMVLPM